MREVKSLFLITFPENLLSTSGLSILVHGVSSLLDATSIDKCRNANAWICCKSFLSYFSSYKSY